MRYTVGMENLNQKHVGIAAIGVVVLGLAVYQLSGAKTPIPEVTPLEESPAATDTTNTSAPAPAAAETKAPARAAVVSKVVEVPVKSFSAGCTSAAGTSTTSGVACDGSAPLAFVTETRLPRATSGVPYTVKIETSGGPKEQVVYTWSVKSKNGGFPVPGLNLTNKYGNTTSIKGTPADIYFDGVRTKMSVTFSIEVTATAGTQSVTKIFNLTVNPVSAE